MVGGWFCNDFDMMGCYAKGSVLAL